jgi:hypothetical protein
MVKNIPIVLKRQKSSSSTSSSSSSSAISKASSTSSIIGKLPASIPIIEKPAAASRLDNIIRQSHSKELINPSSSNYSLPQVRHQDRPQNLEPISMEQQQIITSVHYDDSDEDDQNEYKNKNNNNENDLKHKRSSSASSTASLPAQPVKTKTTTTVATRVPNKYPSFETLRDSYQSDPTSRLSNKTTSLQFGTKPMQDENPGS